MLYGIYFVAAILVFPWIKIKLLESYKNEEKQPVFVETDEVGAVYAKRDEALALRLNLIERAKENLWISYYAIFDDAAGDIFLHALMDAANRGVHVHLLCNGMGMKWKGKSWYKKIALVLHSNIEVRLYSGLNFIKPWRMNNVLHDKLFIVDDNYFMSSGRNIGNRFMLNQDGDVVYDLDFIAKSTSQVSPLIIQGKAYFNRLWNSRYTHETLRGRLFLPKQVKVWCRKKFDACKETLKMQYQDVYQAQPLERLNFQPLKKIAFLHNEMNHNVKVPYIWRGLMVLAKHTKSTYIQTPYMVLLKKERQCLSRKEKVQVLTNCLGGSPNLLAYSGYEHCKRSLLRHLTIYEYQAQGSLHHKTWRFGEKILALGSFNVDPRSMYLNTENMVLVQNESFVRQFKMMTESLQKKSLCCVSISQYKIKADVYRHPLSQIKKWLFIVLYYLTWPIIHLT